MLRKGEQTGLCELFLGGPPFCLEHGEPRDPYGSTCSSSERRLHLPSLLRCTAFAEITSTFLAAVLSTPFLSLRPSPSSAPAPRPQGCTVSPPTGPPARFIHSRDDCLCTMRVLHARPQHPPLHPSAPGPDRQPNVKASTSRCSLTRGTTVHREVEVGKPDALRESFPPSPPCMPPVSPSPPPSCHPSAEAHGLPASGVPPRTQPPAV